MKVRVDIRRHDGLSDPEGTATLRALADLGYDAVTDVHFGRSIYLDVAGTDDGEVTIAVTEMCERLLANPVIEQYSIHLLDG